MNPDLDFIRSQYPVFSNPDTARWAMFENAGGSYVPRQVVDRLHDFFQYTKVQPTAHSNLPSRPARPWRLATGPWPACWAVTRTS